MGAQTASIFHTPEDFRLNRNGTVKQDCNNNNGSSAVITNNGNCSSNKLGLGHEFNIAGTERTEIVNQALAIISPHSQSND